ncbi:YbjN domain-containing protein [Paraburkholderia sp. SUR17]|uniref:YbjN domain-containing protein n=1 Tax=Paraburkholderia sp. SUR17 TaxID=3034358 RepID=UPI002407E80A|nr:YbjN domain-containing protein [Paraburkholderia sp. SUR17]WEY41272.1 YbjN domain-containing protein [Paraburkholderia sp. SUR17]
MTKEDHMDKDNNNAVANEEWIEAVSIEQLAQVFRAAGYRVTMAEQNGAVQLMSASQGVGFAVRFGNVAAGFAVPDAASRAGSQAVAQTATDALRYLDYTLSCVLQVQGELPADLVASWNRTKRFARLANHGPFLALEMDVVVAGGVSGRYLRSTIELWDRLIQEFLLHLRNRPAMAAQEAAARQDTADAAKGNAAVTQSAADAGPAADAQATLQ